MSVWIRDVKASTTWILICRRTGIIHKDCVLLVLKNLYIEVQLKPEDEFWTPCMLRAITQSFEPRHLLVKMHYSHKYQCVDGICILMMERLRNYRITIISARFGCIVTLRNAFPDTTYYSNDFIQLPNGSSVTCLDISSTRLPMFSDLVIIMTPNILSVEYCSNVAKMDKCKFIVFGMYGNFNIFDKLEGAAYVQETPNKC